MTTPLQDFTSVIKRLDGRDKVNMLIQETCKFLYFFLSTKSSSHVSPTSLLKLKRLYSGISAARSVDRLLNSASMVQAFIETLNCGKNTVSNALTIDQYLKMLIISCYAVFFYYDNKLFLGMIGVLSDLDFKKLGLKLNRLWFIALALTLVLLVGGYRSVSASTANMEMNERKKMRKLADLRLKIAKHLCDILMAAQGSGYIPLSDTFVAFLGIMSASIDLYCIKKDL